MKREGKFFSHLGGIKKGGGGGLTFYSIFSGGKVCWRLCVRKVGVSDYGSGIVGLEGA